MLYDVIIIGGGPAASSAAVYTARKKMKTLLIAESFGGQSLVSAGIENWIGTQKISGFEFAQMLEAHVRAQEEIEILTGERVNMITHSRQDKTFVVETNKGTRHEAIALIVATGGRRRRLGVPGESNFEGKGVVFCSTCDAPLFKNKTVVVVGGGNAGLEAVVDLLPYAKKTFLMIRGNEPKGDPSTLDHVTKADKVIIMTNAQVKEILGETGVTGVRYTESSDEQAVKELAVDGVFIEIGSLPNSEFMKDLVKLNERNEIVIDHRTCETSMAGIFAAGDVTDEIYKQNNISAGDAVKAALSAYNYILQYHRGNQASK